MALAPPGTSILVWALPLLLQAMAFWGLEMLFGSMFSQTSSSPAGEYLGHFVPSRSLYTLTYAGNIAAFQQGVSDAEPHGFLPLAGVYPDCAQSPLTDCEIQGVILAHQTRHFCSLQAWRSRGRACHSASYGFSLWRSAIAQQFWRTYSDKCRCCEAYLKPTSGQTGCREGLNGPFSDHLSPQCSGDPVPKNDITAWSLTKRVHKPVAACRICIKARDPIAAFGQL